MAGKKSVCQTPSQGAADSLACSVIEKFQVGRSVTGDSASDAANGLGSAPDRYQQLLEAVHIYAYSVQVHHGVPVATTHGKGCVAITGFTREDYASDPHLWLAMVHPDDRTIVRQHVAQILSGKRVPPFEHRIRRRDGTLRWVRNAVILHRDDEGRLFRYDGLIEDITEHKQAEEHIWANLRIQNVVASLLHLALEPISLDEQLERTLDQILSIPWLALQSRGSIFIVEDDPDVLVMKAHRGLPPELVQQCRTIPLGECLCGTAAANHGIVFAESNGADHVRPHCGLTRHAHYCLPAVSDGRIYGVINLYLESGHKQTPAELSFLAVVADLLAGIIKHKQDEEALRRSEERFDLAVQGTDAGIWDWDLTTNKVYYSAGWKEMVGCAEDEIGDDYREWENRLHPDDRERALATVRAYLGGETSDYELEHRLRHKDGSYRWILARGAAVFDAAGRPHRMVGSHIDITERKRMEVELRQTEASLIAAQRIQQHFLPARPPAFPGYDISGALHPAEFAAGDLFDYLPMLDGSLGIAIGDVSGHGFAPALLMALTHAYLRSAVRAETDVARILAQVNRNLIHESEDDRFVTLLFGCLDPRAQTFTYASAGHPTGYVFAASGELRARLESTGIPLAASHAPTFQVSDPVRLAAGDVLVLITDGILETGSLNHGMFGVDRVLDTVRAHLHETAAGIIDGLYQAVRAFSNGGHLLDDVTAVVVKVDGAP